MKHLFNRESNEFTKQTNNVKWIKIVLKIFVKFTLYFCFVFFSRICVKFDAINYNSTQYNQVVGMHNFIDQQFMIGDKNISMNHASRSYIEWEIIKY